MTPKYLTVYVGIVVVLELIVVLELKIHGDT